MGPSPTLATINKCQKGTSCSKTNAQLLELVDKLDLESGAETRIGASPILGTKILECGETGTHQALTLIGVRSTRTIPAKIARIAQLVERSLDKA